MLNAGDIVVIGMSGDTAPLGTGTGKSFSFVPLVDLTAGEVINFTDSGWLGSSFRANEGGAAYTVPAGGIAAGTVITASGTTNATWDANGPEWTAPIPGGGVGNNGMNFSTSGDQVLVFTGTAASPNFIFALNGASTNFSAPANADDSNRTALPTGLTAGTNAVAAGSGPGDENEFDNVYYTGPTSGDRATILAAVSNASNWTGSNDTYSPISTNFTVSGSPSPSPATNVIINEIDADQTGTDSAEFIELYDGGAGNTPLDGLVVVLFNGSSDTSYDAIDLDGQTTDANGYFVIGSSSVANVDLIEFTSNGLQNGADAVALYQADASDFPNGTAVTATNIVDAIVYDTNDTDDTGLINVLTPGQAQINEGGGGNQTTESIQRIPNGAGGALNTGSYATAAPTPGAANGGSATTLAIAPVTQAEGDAGTSTFSFAVTRSGDTSGTTTVQFDTSDGSATAGSDYVAVTGGILTFNPGETTQNAVVTVNGDATAEPNENFTVTLSNASGGATIATASATGTIQNDDGVAITPIYQIQGAAHTSPLNNTNVTTQGIVTAVAGNGFYLQDPAGDGNDATSDAIFVFTGGAPTVTVNDSIEVAGTVSEFIPGGASTGNLSITQIGSTPVITPIASLGTITPTIVGAGGRVPPNQSIDDDAFTTFEPASDGIDFFESLEGMLVTATGLSVIGGTERFSGGTDADVYAVVDGGASASGLSARGTLNISPNDFNPERIQIDQDTTISGGFTLPDLTVGQTLGDVTGVVSYGFGNFEILPTQNVTAVGGTAVTPESTSLTGTADLLTIASYNVLNLDPNDADGDTDVADNRFATIAGHIANNLGAPDIIGLQEVQDNSGSDNDGTTAANTTLQMLVDAIATAGGPTYQFVDNTFIGNNTSGGQPGGNIRTAFLYDPARVTPNGAASTAPNQAPFTGSRLPLVQTFTFNGEDITVVNNHFSSKGGSAPIFGVQQDFAARQEDVTVNGSLDERQAQSNAVRDDIVAPLLAAGENVAVLGDFNEFEFVSPLTGLEGAGLTNLTNSLPPNERYSFIFQGNSQSLDHVLVNNSLAAAAGFDIVHVNSELPETDALASDHDPIIARIDLTPPPPPAPTPSPTPGPSPTPTPTPTNELHALPLNIQPNDTSNTIEANAPTVAGTPDSETLNLGDADNSIRALASNDNIFAGGGNDFVNGNMGDDFIQGGAGEDTLFGGRDNDYADGGLGNDRIEGQIGNDTLHGADGNDSLFGGGGNALPVSTPDGERDFLDGGNGNDFVQGNAGNDTVYGAAGDDTVRGGKDNDMVFGGSGSDEVFGDLGDDTVSGVWPDSPTPGVGTDIDTLTGGGGADVFVLGTESQVYYDSSIAADNGERDYALITDFEAGSDRVQLNGTAADYLLQATSGSLPDGTGIFRRTPVRDELIAIVAGNATFELTPNFVNFV